jgi:hypothetical protein
MPRGKSGSTFDTVRAIAKSLSDCEEGTAYGSPAIKLRGRLLACIASHKSAEPNTLVIRVSFEQRDAMIADDPGTYYLKDHYVGYPCVLVRLAKIHPDALHDLLHAGWRFVDARTPKRATRRAARRRGPRASPGAPARSSPASPSRRGRPARRKTSRGRSR